MLEGVMLLWFVLAAISLLFVAIDIRTTPESPVLKWGFALLTAYTGVVGAFLYVLGCREPLPGLHERYVAARWRQTLGSTMHCVAGDGVGILAGAVLASVPNQKFLSTMGLDGDRAVTKPFDGGQDVVGGFGPAKRLGVGVAGIDVGRDRGLQRGSRAVSAALDLLVGEQCEEALDLVDP